MKHLYTKMKMSALFLLTCSASASAQTWCTPTTAVPYAQTQPGITQFTLNTINRTSGDLENYPNNSYVNTGLSTTLTAGGTYPCTIAYTIDPTICPDMNLRVWIDLNQDGQLDDPGETVLSVNNQTSLTYTGNITIPNTAMSGTTRMRVTAKMTSNGGHILPSPCDNPVDQLGYHGEFEDYTVIITSPQGVNEQQLVQSLSLFPNPATAEEAQLSYSLEAGAAVSVEVYSVTGQIVAAPLKEQEQTPGDHNLSLAEHALAPGMYFICVQAGEQKQVRKLIIR